MKNPSALQNKNLPDYKDGGFEMLPYDTANSSVNLCVVHAQAANKLFKNPADIADTIYNRLLQGTDIEDLEEPDLTLLTEIMQRCEDQAAIILGSDKTHGYSEAFIIAAIKKEFYLMLPRNLTSTPAVQSFGSSSGEKLQILIAA